VDGAFSCVCLSVCPGSKRKTTELSMPKSAEIWLEFDYLTCLQIFRALLLTCCIPMPLSQEKLGVMFWGLIIYVRGGTIWDTWDSHNSLVLAPKSYLLALVFCPTHFLPLCLLSLWCPQGTHCVEARALRWANRWPTAGARFCNDVAWEVD